MDYLSKEEVGGAVRVDRDGNADVGLLLLFVLPLVAMPCSRADDEGAQPPDLS